MNEVISNVFQITLILSLLVFFFWFIKISFNLWIPFITKLWFQLVEFSLIFNELLFDRLCFGFKFKSLLPLRRFFADLLYDILNIFKVFWLIFILFIPPSLFNSFELLFFLLGK